MINLLIGPPGGGKSYEATVYHILPALAKGRKVITNLPLDMERIRNIDQSYIDLVEVRESTLSKKQGLPNQRCFAYPEDYGDQWRHEKNGTGPLYVIDECHLALPRGGTSIAVEEWFSLHRHESADVLLITQSYGKVSKSIIDLVQVCYRVKKGTAFGVSKQYIRKVQDGVRGDVVNTALRKYESKYFGLYKSHTRGGGEELEANDIVPLWKRWPFIGAALFLVAGVSIFAFSGASINPLKTGTKKPEVQPVSVQTYQDGKLVDDKKTAQVSQVKQVTEAHPYEGRELHVVGTMKHGKNINVIMAVSQNGQAVSMVSSKDLLKLGYNVETPTDCAVKVTYGTYSKWVICDAPQVGIVSVSSRSENTIEAPKSQTVKEDTRL